VCVIKNMFWRDNWWNFFLQAFDSRWLFHHIPTTIIKFSLSLSHFSFTLHSWFIHKNFQHPYDYQLLMVNTSNDCLLIPQRNLHSQKKNKIFNNRFTQFTCEEKICFVSLTWNVGMAWRSIWHAAGIIRLNWHIFELKINIFHIDFGI